MILSKEQYDQMIDDDPFPWYKYSRVSEEEKTLSYLTTNGSENENLVVAIANFGPQPFRGTYGTNFQPPGFERRVCQYNVHVNGFCPGSVPPPGLLPPGIHDYVFHVPGFSYLPGPFLPNLPRLDPNQPRHYPQLYNAPTQSFQRESHNQCDGTVEPGSEKAPLLKPIPWESPAFGPLVVGDVSSDDERGKTSRFKNLSRMPPAYGPLVVGHDSDNGCHDAGIPGCGEPPLLRRRSLRVPTSGPLVVGGDSSDDDENDCEYYGGDEVEPPEQSCLDRKRSRSSFMSNETVEMTSGRVSLTSSRTTPPQASCG